MTLLNTFPPFEDESSLGYYRRLSAKNCLLGWKELASISQVSPTRTGLLGRPEFIALTLGLETSWTAQLSVTENRVRAWRGLQRGQRDAICPHCLLESTHLKAIWEHVFVTACTTHRITLVDQCEKCLTYLSASRPNIEQCVCGHDLRHHATKPATPAQLWLSSLLCIDGKSTMDISPIIIDAEPEKVSKLVRTLCLLYNPSEATPKRNAAAPRTLTEALEFLRPLETLLFDWPNCFEDHVKNRIEAGTVEATTLNKLLGQWYLQLKRTCVSGALRPFLNSVVQVAQNEFSGIVGLDAAGVPTVGARSFVLLKVAAQATGASRDQLIAALSTGQITGRSKKFGTRSLLYEIDIDEVQRIKNARGGWVNEEQACRTLGVAPSILSHLIVIGAVNFDAHWKGDFLKGGPLDAISLQNLALALHSQRNPAPFKGVFKLLNELTNRRLGDKSALQNLFRAITRGDVLNVGGRVGEIGTLRYRLEDVEKYFGTPKLEAGLSLYQLSKLTGWKYESLGHWIEEGLLEADTIMLRGQRCRVVMPFQLLRFAQTYVPLADLAKTIGSKASALSMHLPSIAIIGGKPLVNGHQRGGLVRLSDLARWSLIGLTSVSQ
jgi:hypothetical protein